MKEISGRATRPIVAELREHGNSDASIALGLDATAAELTDASARISWNDFAKLLDRAAELLNGCDALEKIGGRYLDSDSFETVKKIVRFTTRSRDLYRVAVSWLGPALFPNIRDDLQELPSGELRLTLEIPDPCRESLPLFSLMLGVLRSAPRNLRQEDAVVAMDAAPRRAVYRIYPPVSRTLAARLSRALPSKSAMAAALGELSAQQAMLRQNYQELRNADVTIERQASQLDHLNRLSQKLAVQIDLDALGEAILVILQSHFQCDVAIWVTSSSTGALRLLCSTGNQHKAPARSHLLKTAGRLIGRLDIWEAETVNETPLAPEVSTELIPWIAIALDNAHAYSVIRQDAARLRAEIAGRKRAEDESRRLEAQLNNKRKLESFGLMAGAIAHDFNTLLLGVLANAEALVADLEPGSRGQMLAEEIDVTSQRAAHLVAELLNYTGETAFRFELVDLVELIRGEEARLRRSIPEGIRLDCSLVPHRICIKSDLAQIHRVVENLIRNSVDALPNHQGSVSLRVGTMKADREFLVSCNVVGDVKEGEYAYLEVEDNGCGMDTDTLQRIFDPFFTTKVTGNGLGLACVVEIVKSHGGAVHVTSEPGCGTTFRILLTRVICVNLVPA